ncbi:MAG: ABC transporter ATP-binding protein [Candidatus Omnitrophota bacterium]|nr:ABC transporter ATP-binding protein [Candidatus Omnitrophota bacterium]
MLIYSKSKGFKFYHLFAIIKPYTHIYLWIIFFTFLSGFLASLNIVAISPLLNFVLPGSAQGGNLLFLKVQSLTGLIPVKDSLFAATIFLLLITISAIFSALFLEYLIAFGSSRVAYHLKDSLFRKYASLDFQFFIEHKHGEIFYYLFSAPQSIMTLLTTLPQLIGEVIHILFLIGVLFFINYKLTVFIICFIVIFNMLITIVARKISYTLGQRRKTLSLKQQVITNEFLNGIKHIIVHLAKPRWIDNFDKTNKCLSDIYLKEAMWLAIPKNTIDLSMYLFVIAIALLSANRIVYIKNLADTAIFLAACVRLLPRIANVGRMRMTVMRLLPDAEAVQDISALQENRVSPGTKNFSTLKASIEFKDVHFSYKDRPPFLKGLNFTIEALKTTAIVGKSGSGKTTIVNLLLKLIKPGQGEILVDGVSLNEYTSESWLRQISFVSQEPFLFHADIKDNITFGDKGYSMREVVRAAEIAHADEFIETLPDRYETIVGEKGMKLSAGQQQRIAIARAILRNPAILIFDEATNSLDNISEEMIQKAMREISGTKTVIIVAHRLSSIRDADNILVIKDGFKIEEGTHSELAKSGQYYYRLYLE